MICRLKSEVSDLTNLYKNAKLNGEIVDILCENGKIKKIGKIDGEGTDLKGNEVYAGLVDVHTHGNMGNDTMDGNHLVEISQYLAKWGVTSFLPTTMTMDFDLIKSVVNDEIPKTDGAQILGFHLEGPYIAESRRGAQNIKYIRKPDIKEFEELKNIRMVTIAPEVDGAMDFIKNCKTVVSLGHTDADYDTSIKSMENGANCLTHTFNAMTPMHHVNPGPVGAAIEKNIYVQVICDGTHIHKSVITMLYRTFGKERMVLISDSMNAAGLPDGLYEFGGQPVRIEGNVARTLEGVVAGSTSNLLKVVKKAVEFGISKKDAFEMASKTPCALIGEKTKGQIKEGFDADFVVVDNDINPLMTVIAGLIASNNF